jgi:alkanesulfonate monooxygenase SsuD/methylene tetrahydromethanopterin reductase-like flavin-dependent oxidoreductase (luciferase family)
VKLGLSLTVFTADPVKPMAAATRAAAGGYDAVFASDHLFPPGAPDRPSLEPYTLLAAIATMNPGLGVGVLVTRAGYRPIGLLAKQSAALDDATGGRAVIGLGIGDANGRAEHRAIGLDYPPFPERAATAEESALALRALFAGDPWPGGDRIPPIAGPLLPPGAPSVWIGGTKTTALAAAARTADGWNGWGLDEETFLGRAGELAEHARAAGRDPRDVPPTWAGIVLVGRDAAELGRLETDRVAKGLPMEIWRGTTDDLRRFRDRLDAAGTTWLITLAAGPADRVDLIAAMLRDG